METTIHALWNCHKLQYVRNEWLSKYQKIPVETGNFFDFFSACIDQLPLDIRELLCIVLWRIWFLRNTLAHEAIKGDKNEIIGWSEKYLEDYHLLNSGIMRVNASRDRESIGSRVGWSPPNTDEYKTNCGIAIDSNSGKISLGILVRNSGGEVMACCSQKLNAYLSKRDANALAILKGIQFCIDCGLNSGMIESNDEVVVKWINLGLHRDSDVGIILSDIDGLGADRGGLSFSHIPFQSNRAALGLAKFTLRIAEDRFWMEDLPDCISNFVEMDKPG